MAGHVGHHEDRDSPEDRIVRVLLADQERDHLDEIADVVQSLGHEVIGKELAVDRVGGLTRLERPDLAIVGLGASGPHALDLITEIVDEAVCPVVVRIDEEQPDLVREAARHGVFAYIVSSGGRDAMEGAGPTSTTPSSGSDARPGARTAASSPWPPRCSRLSRSFASARRTSGAGAAAASRTRPGAPRPAARGRQRAAGSRRLRQQRAHVERRREHSELAVRPARPLLPRAVPVELDAVAVGVAEVERLADAVVGRALERDPRLDEPPQRLRERRPVGVADRDVVEAGRARRRGRAARRLPRVEADVVVVAAGREERGAVAEPQHLVEAEHVAPESERAVEVCDLQVDMADVDARVDHDATIPRGVSRAAAVARLRANVRNEAPTRPERIRREAEVEELLAALLLEAVAERPR